MIYIYFVSSEYFSEVLGFYWCGMCVVVAIVPLKKKSKGGDESRSYRAFSTTTTTYTTATKYISATATASISIFIHSSSVQSYFLSSKQILPKNLYTKYTLYTHIT